MKLLNTKIYKISCILTQESRKYINLKELKTYTGRRVYTDNSEKKNRMLHINLSRENDIIIVCPATANTLAKFANGYGDNLASNTLLASNKKILFAPAMNSHMWANKSNQNNIKILKNRGYDFIGPEVGNLKCGEYGIGRISDSVKILKQIKINLEYLNLYQKKICLVTAGPTLEMIDPIRYISNNSSGKQGYELAYQLALNGAKVTLISGPTNIDPPPNVKFIQIKSAEEMFKKIENISNIEFAFFTAAVSDFKSKNFKKSKIKKKRFIDLKLIKNIDILEKIGNSKNNRPKFVIGFAAETRGLSAAKTKLKNKNCDLIVYNKIDRNNQVFGSDYNKISIITKDKVKNFSKMTKINCAKKIIRFVYNYSISK
tara:strand:- start:1729 stop:2847 length:1119 start_codon:yes stop_codon:yes gene_type:complete